MSPCLRIALGITALLLLLPLGALGQTADPMPPLGPAPTAAASADTTQDVGASIFGPLPAIDLIPGQEDFALPIQLVLLLTVLSIAPAIIILTTCFTRLVVVFGLLRQAMGTHQAPPNQVLIGLAMFLTVFIMYPVFERIHEDALKPYMAGTITQEEAFDAATLPMKMFMLNQTREKDLMLFMDLAGVDVFESAEEVPLHILVPSFVISELRIAFQIGFMIFLPFLVVDIIVASVLMSMGMMMLPPVMISLPLKLLLFVLADGWFLIVESVVRGYAL